MNAWLFPLFMGMVLGSTITGIAWSLDNLERQVEPVQIQTATPEMLEADLWSVDIDGESAP